MADRSREELAAIQRRMRDVFPIVHARLKAIPGVVGVGIGFRQVGGELTLEPVFTVDVIEKKAPGDVPPGEMIPSEIEGFPVDVQVFQAGDPEDDRAKYRPIKGGIRIERKGSSRGGTLGCLARLDADDTVVLLTNAHVVGLAQNDTAAGLSGSDAGMIELGQPCHTTSCCCTCNDIAVTLHAVRHLHLDFAIARIKEGIQIDAEIEEIGPITGVAAPMMVGETVHKRGKTTGHTTGMISKLTMNGMGVIERIEVKKNMGNDRFSEPGDSGSALLNDNDEIIGLHFRGNNGPTVVAPNFLSISCPIQLVLSTLAANMFPITIITGEGGESLTVQTPAEAAKGDLLWAVELRLRQTEAGRMLWALVERHQDEVLHLVNHVRPVIVVWQRNQGPAFTAALGRSIREPLYRIPHELNGVSRVQLAIALATVLDAYGSETLRADLAQHRDALEELLVAGDTAEEMFERWEQQEARGASMAASER